MNDVWTQYYTQNDPTIPALINVCEVIHYNQPPPEMPTTVTGPRKATAQVPPPILIESGASCSVVGERWLESWGKQLSFPDRIRSGRGFQSGDGPAFPIQGEMNLPVVIPKERTSDKVGRTLVLRVEVVKAVVPLLISQQALTQMQGRMDFPTFALEIPSRYTIRLTKSATGHVLLPGITTQDSLKQATRGCAQVFPLQASPMELRTLNDSEVLKIHHQLGHCSERKLLDLLKFGACEVGSLQIQRIAQKCKCHRSAHRITPPMV